MVCEFIQRLYELACVQSIVKLVSTRTSTVLHFSLAMPNVLKNYEIVVALKNICHIYIHFL